MTKLSENKTDREQKAITLDHLQTALEEQRQGNRLLRDQLNQVETGVERQHTEAEELHNLTLYLTRLSRTEA